MKINLIQHVPTPHIDEMVLSLTESGNTVEVWYFIGSDDSVYNTSDINIKESLYGPKIDVNFLCNLLKKKEEVIIITGWMNVNMILLNLLFSVTNTFYFYWTDKPSEINLNSFKNFKRHISTMILKYSNSKILCVGITAVNYFIEKKFNPKKLINFPIYIKSNQILFKEKKTIWRYNNYKINKDIFLISAGSRLEHEKGYDLLIEAVSVIRKEYLKKIKIIIIGEGSLKESLSDLISKYNLENNFIFSGWKSIDEYKEIVSNSDLFIHPARHDSYGASIFALAAGVPVIGSNGAGAVMDRVKHNFNGLIYDSNNTTQLSDYITLLFLNPSEVQRFSINAFEDSKSHTPINYNNILKSLLHEITSEKEFEA